MFIRKYFEKVKINNNPNLLINLVFSFFPISFILGKILVNTNLILFCCLGIFYLRSKIIKKVKIINSFYKKIFNKKPNFAILGLNPHNFSPSKKAGEKKIIYSAIKSLIKFKIKVSGPIPTDSSFMIFKRHKFDVIIGMYHDQVLTPFKALYNFKAINITLGLPYIRISPDHGVAENITGKGIANPRSLIESIKFFNYIN